MNRAALRRNFHRGKVRRVNLAIVFDRGVAPNCEVAGRRHQSAATIAKRVDIGVVAMIGVVSTFSATRMSVFRSSLADSRQTIAVGCSQVTVIS